MNKHIATNESGFVIVLMMLMISVLLALLSAYAAITDVELATAKSYSFGTRGFYTAEAGLNIRAEEIRQSFVGYNLPSGTSPDTSGSTEPCDASNEGSGDFICKEYTVDGHTSTTYILGDGIAEQITIPPGERYQNLSALEYTYTVHSGAKRGDDSVEAILELHFKSRLVPMFQFVAFYDKDLEILPGPAMTLSGPVHTNGDLYLDAGNSLTVLGQITSAGDIYRGRKNDSSCKSKNIGVVKILPNTTQALLNSCSSRTMVNDPGSGIDLSDWNDFIEAEVEMVTVPEPEALDPGVGNTYFDSADFRLVLKLDDSNNPDTSNSATGVEFRNSSNTTDSGSQNALDACAGSINETSAGANDGTAVGYSNSFYDNREKHWIRMLEVDAAALFDCLHSNSAILLGIGKTLADDTQEGLVFHFSVDGPDSGTQPDNPYGIRIRNAEKLGSTVAGAPDIQGLTVVSDVAAYTWGHYNSVDKKPASILADSFNPLSVSWDDADTQNWSARGASNTTFNAAILAGTDTTGGVEGSGGQGGGYNGGLENYPRFHENWSGKEFTYRGSFVSLNRPRYSDGAWKYGSPNYTAPIRNWDFDLDFNDPEKLPPMTPRFVYLRQLLFVRNFEQ